jgi:hypothetical protein
MRLSNNWCTFEIVVITHFNIRMVPGAKASILLCVHWIYPMLVLNSLFSNRTASSLAPDFLALILIVESEMIVLRELVVQFKNIWEDASKTENFESRRARFYRPNK